MIFLDQQPKTGQGFIAMADIETPVGVIRLASPLTNDEYARVLYQALRAGDEQGLDEIVAIQPVGEDIAAAIRDRLKKASSKQ